jgi:hypothetical protein
VHSISWPDSCNKVTAGLKNITCFGVKISNQILKDNKIFGMGWKKLFFNPHLDSSGEKKNSRYNIQGDLPKK